MKQYVKQNLNKKLYVSFKIKSWFQIMNFKQILNYQTTGGRNSPIYASIENFNGKLDFDIQPILKFDENMLCSTYLPSSNVHCK